MNWNKLTVRRELFNFTAVFLFKNLKFDFDFIAE